jgi:hypothetical protein
MIAGTTTAYGNTRDRRPDWSTISASVPMIRWVTPESIDMAATRRRAS